MTDTQAPAKAAAPQPRERPDPVSSYLLRRLKAAEDEALSANVQLAKALTIAEHFKAIAQRQEAEIAALKAAAETSTPAEAAPAKPKRKS
jgi:hypothetical protein